MRNYLFKHILWESFAASKTNRKFNETFYGTDKIDQNISIIPYANICSWFSIPIFNNLSVRKREKKGHWTTLVKYSEDLQDQSSILVYHFWKQAFCHSFLFFTFSPALLISIPSPIYQSKMTYPLFFQYAFMTSSR